jgi:hypothetical protein
MNKRKVAFIIVTILLIVISGAFGYLTAYVKGLENAILADVNTHCSVLKLESLRLSRQVGTSGIKGLIDAVEDNGDTWASYINVNKPYRPDNTKLIIADAVAEWEKARAKLAELRTSYEENNKSVQIENK